MGDLGEIGRKSANSQKNITAVTREFSKKESLIPIISPLYSLKAQNHLSKGNNFVKIDKRISKEKNKKIILGIKSFDFWNR